MASVPLLLIPRLLARSGDRSTPPTFVLADSRAASVGSLCLLSAEETHALLLMVSTSFIPVENVEVVPELSGRELASLSFSLKCNNGRRFAVNCRTG